MKLAEKLNKKIIIIQECKGESNDKENHK